MSGAGLSAPTACPACAEPVTAGDAFCEACGQGLAEVDLGHAAASSDRGRAHRRNEDAFALAVRGATAAVAVCDGVSISTDPHRASRLAADAAVAHVIGGLDEDDPATAVMGAVVAARRAVTELPTRTVGDLPAPSTTLVVARWDGTTLAVASVGDSRAYWLGADGAEQLTTDDSWSRLQLEAGLLTADEAARHPNAHAITHWIGADAPDEPTPVVVLEPVEPGLLVLCTDGLWDYLPAPADLAAAVAASGTNEPAVIVRHLVDLALDRGGHDNVTVAVVAIDPREQR